MAHPRQESAAGPGAAEDERIATVVASQLEARMAGLEARLRGDAQEAADRSSTQAASASTARLGEQLAPVRAAVAEREREIAELRRRLVDNEETVLELVLALGRLRRHKGARHSDAAPAEAASHEHPPAGEPAPPPPTAGSAAHVQEVAATPPDTHIKG
jgi:hypothetical protein